MRITLTDEEASEAARHLALLKMIQIQSDVQISRVMSKLADLEAKIRTRIPDLPQVPIASWNWSELDLIEGRGTATIPDDTARGPL